MFYFACNHGLTVGPVTANVGILAKFVTGLLAHSRPLTDNKTTYDPVECVHKTQ